MKIRAMQQESVIDIVLADRGQLVGTLIVSGASRNYEEKLRLSKEISDEVVKRINLPCEEEQNDVSKSIDESFTAIHAKHIEELKRERKHSHEHCAEIAALKKELKKEQFEVCRLQKIIEEGSIPEMNWKVRAENAERKLQEIRRTVCRHISGCDAL